MNDEYKKGAHDVLIKIVFPKSLKKRIGVCVGILFFRKKIIKELNRYTEICLRK